METVETITTRALHYLGIKSRLQLRWNEKWRGVVIAHDLTKVEYLEEKQRETQLKKVAEERNEKLTESGKILYHWKVIGGRGRRRVVLMPIRM